LPNALLRRGFAAQNGSTALGLALLIKSYEGKRKAFPKASDLAKLLGVNVSTVHRNKRRLEKLGILSWDRGRTGRANEYSVNLGPERWNHQTKK
jgi:DNA-binding MarR family transcriptional regulator